MQIKLNVASQSSRRGPWLGTAVLILCFGQVLQAHSIDRHALVTRHNIVLTNADPLTPLSVGNGQFAFTADVTGLQSFPEFHEKGMLLSTMSQWGWHSFPNPEHYTLEDVLVPYDSHGRKVLYADGAIDAEENPAASARSKAANHWLRANPHRLDLARIGLVLNKSDGSRAAITDLEGVNQTLDLWNGLLQSRFSLEGKPACVQTVGHPERDLIAVRIDSPLLRGRALVRIAFPYAAGDWMKAADWSQPAKHETRLLQNERAWQFERRMDETRYLVSLRASKGARLANAGPHEFLLQAAPGEPEVLEFTIAFTPTRDDRGLPGFREVQSAAARHWKRFWKSGGAIDLSGSTDPRWFELERRIVLSQYLTAVNCAGSMPPQETGLVENSWYGKPHLEMHWWHAAHFALWGREKLLERSLGWYRKILPAARGLAHSQGYVGARWPKMTDSSGAQTPSSVAVFLIWEQPHPIFYAELLRRAHPGSATLKQYADLVFQTADFMADYAFWDRENQRYVLGPPVIPAQESYAKDRARIFNPTYELAYWQWALQVAQRWREDLGLAPKTKWAEVARNLSQPTIREGAYTAIEPPPYTVTRDHPSMLCALGVLPRTDLINEKTMGATLDRVLTTWDWSTTWGWDYPVLAMTAARLGQPGRAIDALFLDTPKNRYLANGHNYQRSNLPLYLPGNGGLLYAVAMMAAGWDGAPALPAPGFPAKGWRVKSEGLRPAP